MNNTDFKEIIDFAVENEVEAYEFYRDAAEKLNDDYLKQVFGDLAKEELEHKRFLEEFASSGIEKIKLDDVSDYKIAETLDTPKLSVEMNFVDAIALAIKKEQEAVDMYRNLADACLDQEEKDLFVGLERIEKMHKARLEDIYIDVAYAEVW